MTAYHFTWSFATISVTLLLLLCNIIYFIVMRDCSNIVCISAYFILFTLIYIAPSMKITILPEFALQVMWTPAPDASRSSLTYVMNVTVESVGTERLFAAVTHPISLENFTGFSSYSAGSVLLQATNPGAISNAVTVSFRMVNLTGEGVLAIRLEAHESSLHAYSCTVLQLIRYFSACSVFKLFYCSE